MSPDGFQIPDDGFPRLLQCVTSGGVEFIIIGGFAATAHGSALVTFDLDLVYRRTPENLQRLAKSLEPLSPSLRGAPPGLPFRFDVSTIERGLNFALSTTAGDLDLSGEAAGGGTYDGSFRIQKSASFSGSSAGS